MPLLCIITRLLAKTKIKIKGSSYNFHLRGLRHGCHRSVNSTDHEILPGKPSMKNEPVIFHCHVSFLEGGKTEANYKGLRKKNMHLERCSCMTLIKNCFVIISLPPCHVPRLFLGRDLGCAQYATSEWGTPRRLMTSRDLFGFFNILSYFSQMALQTAVLSLKCL